MTMSHSMLKPQSLDKPHPIHQYSIDGFRVKMARQGAALLCDGR